MKHAGQIIRAFYGLKRPVTEDEITDTLAMLERKRDTGQLDDRSADLAARLDLKGAAISD